MEKKQYGWFWVCPNGNKECHYRHALPPGYILKSQMKALLEEEANKLAIEDEIEDQVIIFFHQSSSSSLCHWDKLAVILFSQRAKVKTTTPMTTDLFMGWKKKKVDEKEAGLAALRADRAKNDRMRFVCFHY